MTQTSPQAGASATLLARTLASIAPADREAQTAAEARQLTLTKPPGALGQLEDLGNRLAAIAGACPPPVPEPAAVCVFAGDHGVHAQGVSPWPQEVTTQMVANMLGGGAAVSVLARHAGAELRVYDVGVASPLPDDPTLRGRPIAPGTADLTTGPAMTADQCATAIEAGITAALDAVADGHRCLIPGEVGIGNTTPAAALIAVFTGRPTAEVTGTGAGADPETLRRKIDLVTRAIARDGVRADDPLSALASVGGFEHAAIVGLILGGAASRVPVILDGVVSCSAALVATALCPDALGYLIAGHAGVEPGIRAALDALSLAPVVALDMRLGEGSGALTALPIVQASAKILREMATFDSAGVSER